MLFAIIFFGILLFLFIVIGWMTSSMVIDKKTQDEKYIRSYMEENNEPDLNAVDLFKDKFQIDSTYGYQISGVYHKGDQNPSKTIVFSHGIGWNWYGMSKYMQPFIDEGWNIIAYDHRAHGNSGGKYQTYGFYEKYDMEIVVDFAFEKFPGTKFLGIYGESMGGATALQYAAIDRQADFIIEDCSFSDLPQLLKKEIAGRFGLPGFICSFIYFSADLFSYLRSGFKFENSVPIHEISETEIPLMIFHGREDSLAPVAMAEKIYEARKNQGLTEIYIQEGAEHACSVITDRENYMKKMKQFIQKVEGNMVKKSGK